MPVHIFSRLPDEETLVIPAPVEITAGPLTATLTLSGSSEIDTGPIPGMGTIFQRGDGGAPEAFVTLAEVMRIQGPLMVRKMIDATTLDSSGEYREWIPGGRNGERIALTMNYFKDGYSILLSDFQERAMRNYRVIINDNDDTQMDFSARVIKLPLSIPRDRQISMLDVIFKITGEVTVT